MGDALLRVPHPPAHAEHVAKQLHKRAERLATASPLDDARQLKDALSLALGSFDHAAMPSAQRRLVEEAQAAVAALRDDRPLALQQAAAEAALRLLSEAIVSER
jgi:hypothetical protein